ncbi:REF/SRPP-like protein [Forsythia ovata]|uniref:REF/SRPP-like protein n=1 Tax=Forsythia ovata TaxID=205694 RepID=A0ABD1TCC5_9LAMI
MVSAKVEQEGSEMQLKHLRFVRILAINAVVMVSNLYDYAKQNSGPLKSTVGTVENAVSAVVGPVYEKFKDVPGDFLVFLDKKVDEATYKFDKCAPPLAKKAVRKTQSVVNKASQDSPRFGERSSGCWSTVLPFSMLVQCPSILPLANWQSCGTKFTTIQLCM